MIDPDFDKVVGDSLYQSIASQEGEALYSLYCSNLDSISIGGGFVTATQAGIKDIKLPTKFMSFFKKIKPFITDLAEKAKIGVSEVILAFKQKDIFALFKAIKFNLAKLFKAVNSATTLMRKGLLKVFQEIHKTKLFQKIDSGAMKLDELLDKYPILKKVTGPVIAGILVYIWLNMTFIGDLDFDFDISAIPLALAGTYTLHELFTSPEGLMTISLLATGALTGISAPWLGKTLYNLILGLAYTGLKLGREVELAQRILPYVNSTVFGKES